MRKTDKIINDIVNYGYNLDWIKSNCRRENINFRKAMIRMIIADFGVSRYIAEKAYYKLI